MLADSGAPVSHNVDKNLLLRNDKEEVSITPQELGLALIRNKVPAQGIHPPLCDMLGAQRTDSRAGLHKPTDSVAMPAQFILVIGTWAQVSSNAHNHGINSNRYGGLFCTYAYPAPYPEANRSTRIR